MWKTDLSQLLIRYNCYCLGVCTNRGSPCLAHVLPILYYLRGQTAAFAKSRTSKERFFAYKQILCKFGGIFGDKRQGPLLIFFYNIEDKFKMTTTQCNIYADEALKFEANTM